MKITKVFLSGNSQAVRIPKEYRFTTKQVTVTQVAQSIILTPVKQKCSDLREILAAFDPDFMEERQQPPVTEIRKGF